jgi:methylenetetrahydrofolate reductase (NADPH)
LGVEVATQMCRTLLDEGVPGIHFITMNRWEATRAVCTNLALPRGRQLAGARAPITADVA